MGQVDAAVGRVWPLALRVKDVEVVAGDAAHHLRPACLDLVALLVCKTMHEVGDLALSGAQTRDGAEGHQPAVREPRVDAGNVVHHVPVGNASAAAGVVACHAAERRLGLLRTATRYHQAVGLSPGLRGAGPDPGSTVDRNGVL